MPATVIIRNMAKCKKCGDIIKSESVHDFRKCRCGALAVDGGHEYLRRLYDEKDMYEELSVTEIIQDPVEWEGIKPGDTAWAILEWNDDPVRVIVDSFEAVNKEVSKAYISVVDEDAPESISNVVYYYNLTKTKEDEYKDISERKEREKEKMRRYLVWLNENKKE